MISTEEVDIVTLWFVASNLDCCGLYEQVELSTRRKLLPFPVTVVRNELNSQVLWTVESLLRVLLLLVFFYRWLSTGYSRPEETGEIMGI